MLARRISACVPPPGRAASAGVDGERKEVGELEGNSSYAVRWVRVIYGWDTGSGDEADGQVRGMCRLGGEFMISS